MPKITDKEWLELFQALIALESAVNEVFQLIESTHADKDGRQELTEQNVRFFLDKTRQSRGPRIAMLVNNIINEPRYSLEEKERENAGR